MWAQKRSVSNCAYDRPHMLQITARDETYLKLNSVMTLRHSRKRDKVYFKKLFYLRNFLNLLQVYRVYLGWKYRKRTRLAIDWHKRLAIEWKMLKLEWNPFFHKPKVNTTVIFRFYQCQLTLTYLINSPRIFFFDIAPVDKILSIPSGRETLRRNMLIVCEGGDGDEYDDSVIFRCKINSFVCTNFKCFFFSPFQVKC